MKNLKSLAKIKAMAQAADMAVVRWIKTGMAADKQKVAEVQSLLHKSVELADAPLRIAIVGEFNSGKSTLLDALLRSSFTIFSISLIPINILEAKITFSQEDRHPQVHGARLSFLNRFEVEEILQNYADWIRQYGIEGTPQKVSLRDLDAFEEFLVQNFDEIKFPSIEEKYDWLSALEFTTAVKSGKSIIEREERYSCSLPLELIYNFTFSFGRPDIGKPISEIHQWLQKRYRSDPSYVGRKIQESDAHALSLLVRRIEMEATVWGAPFGIFQPAERPSVTFLDCPGLVQPIFHGRMESLVQNAIQEAHAVLAVFQAPNLDTESTSLAKEMLLRRTNRARHTLVVLNLFDEVPLKFDPSSEPGIQDCYLPSGDNAKINWETFLAPVQDLLSAASSRFPLYLSSALCYPFTERRWHFFDYNKHRFYGNRETSFYVNYERSREIYQKILDIPDKGEPALQILKESLKRYLVQAGIPDLREDIVRLAQKQGEPILREQALKPLHEAYKIMASIAPQTMKKDILSEL